MLISSEKQLGSPKKSVTPSFHQKTLKPLKPTPQEVAAQKSTKSCNFNLQQQRALSNEKKILTLPKTKMDTQNVGLEKVTPFKHGNFWYLC